MCFSLEIEKSPQGLTCFSSEIEKSPRGLICFSLEIEKSPGDYGAFEKVGANALKFC